MNDLVIESLATWRLVRLIMRDEITRDARMRALQWALDGGHRKLHYLITCPHCIGPYAAAFVIALRWVPRGRVLRDLLAVAGLQSVMWEIEPKATETDD